MGLKCSYCKTTELILYYTVFHSQSVLLICTDFLLCSKSKTCTRTTWKMKSNMCKTIKHINKTCIQMIRSDRSSLQWNVNNYVTKTITVSVKTTVTLDIILCFALNWRLFPIDFHTKAFNAIIPSQTATEEWWFNKCLTEVRDMHVCGRSGCSHRTCVSPSLWISVIFSNDCHPDVAETGIWGGEQQLLFTVWPRPSPPNTRPEQHGSDQSGGLAHCVLHTGDRKTVARCNTDTWPHYGVLLISENNIEYFSSM